MLAESVEKENPVVAYTVHFYFYMDDLLTGTDTVAEAPKLQAAIHLVLVWGQFPLQKYISNSAELMSFLIKELMGKVNNRVFD